MAEKSGPGRVRRALVALTGLLVGLTVLVHQLFIAGPDELWRLPGASRAALQRVTAEPDWDTYLHWDIAWAILIAATLFAALFVRRGPECAGWGYKLHRRLAAGAITGYLASDVQENWMLLDILRSPKTADAKDALNLARWSASKWGFLAAALVLVAAAWPRRVPDVQPATAWKAAPNNAPTNTWAPNPKRFGIAVSGGGVRSASFAMGALQELRGEQLLDKARYVTSASGGSYTTMAYTAINQGDSTPQAGAAPVSGVASPVEGPSFAPASPEEQGFRRSLRYLATDKKVLAGAAGRILLGLIINLALLYWILFVVVRPVGWLIGTPFVQRGLRVEQSVVTKVDHHSDDPDGVKKQPYADCGGLRRPDPPLAELEVMFGDLYFVSGDPPVPAREVTVETRAQCVRVAARRASDTVAETVSLTQTRPGVVTIVNGRAVIERQPTVSADKAYVLAVQPMLTIAPDSGGLADSADLNAIVKLARAATVEPESVLEMRRPLDIDVRHWVPPLAALAVTLLLGLWRVIGRPRFWKGLNKAVAIAGIATLISGLVLLVLPSIVDALPRAASNLPEPSPALAKVAGWIPPGLAPVVAWPLLAGVSLFRFFSKRKSSTPSKSTGSRNGRAFMRKISSLIQGVAIGLLLSLIALSTLMTILVQGAMTGPGGQLPWLSRDLFGHDLVKHLPADAVLWFGLALALVLSQGVGESMSWSPAPIYKRRLAWAFAWARTGYNEAQRRTFADDQAWEHLSGPDARAGFVDGKNGDGTELVLCCSANVLGEDRAPTGRRAVSFTASRSYIGGSEVGWVDTPTYVSRMGRRRKWDITLPGLTAISGAAVSPAMGKARAGPIGSVLAVLNVRLGAWLPHPSWVDAMPPGTQWEHNPSWPWFVREVVRSFRGKAPYLYVTDGGHWDNLGLVEALRRGCSKVVVISAAGDGDLSHETFAQAVEQARSDLGVEISLDEIWLARPTAGGEPTATLPSGRQYIVTDAGGPTVGRVGGQGFAFGTFTFPDSSVKGELLLIEATMVDGLPVDVHSYAEGHDEFPNISTGDQFFTNRDFEAYRILGREILRTALGTVRGLRFGDALKQCERTST